MRFYHFAFDVMVILIVLVAIIFPIGVLKQGLILMSSVFCLMIGMVLWRFEKQQTMIMVMTLISVLGLTSII